MAVETPTWKYKSKGDKQTASEMNQLAQSVIANAIELSNIEELVANLADDDDLENTIINGAPVIREKTTKTYNPENYSGMGRVILRKNMINLVNVLTQEMINQENTIYEIRYDFDLNGEEITLPSGCILYFNGGIIKNGTLNGNDSLLKGNILFKTIHFGGTFLNNNINSNIIIDSCYIKDLITLIKDGGVVNLDKNIYHDGLLFTVEKSFTINGNGNILYIPKQQEICSDFLFDTKNCEYININNLIIDGQVSETAYADGYRIRHGYPIEHNFKWLMMMTEVKNVIIQNCYFKNLWYQDYGNPDFPTDIPSKNESLENFAHTGFLGFIRCDKVILENNSFKNIYAEEGIISCGKVDEENINNLTGKTEIVYAINNKFICGGSFNVMSNSFEPTDSNLSTWLDIFYERCIIKNNIFGCCGGSQLNAFCYDSEIINNKFESNRSGAIDLDEGSYSKLIPKNVVIANNISEGCTIFIQTSCGVNIKIENNILDNSKIPDGYGNANLAFIFHNRNEEIAPLSEFFPIQDFFIIKNISKGSLFFIRDDNFSILESEKQNYIIKDNWIESRKTYARMQGGVVDALNSISARPVIWLGSFKKVLIENNYFKNAGRPMVWGSNSQVIDNRAEVFILQISYKADNYWEDINIEKNIFETDNYNFILGSLLYNTNQVSRKYFLCRVNGLKIENNICSNSRIYFLANEVNLNEDETNLFLNNKNVSSLISNILFKRDFPKEFTKLPNYSDAIGLCVNQGIKYYTYSTNELIEFLQRSYPARGERTDRVGTYLTINGKVCLAVQTGQRDGNIVTYTDNGNLKQDGTFLYYELEEDPGSNHINYSTLINNV